MGLDMYIYKARRPHLDPNRVYTEEELDQETRLLIKDAWVDDCNREILRYADTVKMGSKVINVKDFLTNHGFDPEKDNMYCQGRSIIIYPHGNKNYVEINLSKQEMDAIVTTIEQTVHVVDIDEFCYWRKAYGMQEYIHDLIWQRESTHIENCGYYELTAEEMEDILKRDSKSDYYANGSLSSDSINWKIVEIKEHQKHKDPDTGFFYLEWY